ncbi:L-threonylcarbamoyladenylate synthase [Flaviaesturariibacter amylovorans]|uniref:L-threonylcarbamoyladenylate synthase n=1 Tax=Flaviaesturariibacter amylovorans TaxID=1084520 RepID=A0ABP8GEW1_9BACT
MNNDPAFFESEVTRALEVLRSGGTILYPTDTVWGLGCAATDAAAIARIYALKQRPDSKSMIVLVGEERDILQYIAAPDLAAFTFMQEQERPTTVIFDGAVGLPDNLVAADGSIAIRIVRDPFCRHLVKRLRVPIVSTSANISGEPTAPFFGAVSEPIRAGVDHVVRWRQDDESPAVPSQIVRWQDGAPVFIRK